MRLDELRDEASEEIETSAQGSVLSAHVNDDIMKTLAEKERGSSKGINNWIFVFDWKAGSFVMWDIVSRDPDEAANKYAEYEKIYPADQSYEVVLIGSSDIAAVRSTHSHYFGVAAYDKVLETLQDSIVGFSRRMDLDVGGPPDIGGPRAPTVLGKQASV